VDSVYLSSDQPRLRLASEADVHAAVAQQLLEENHFLDLKREVRSSRALNKETARDLAQFAIDGGTVVVGLAELDDGTIDLTPQPLNGLAEQIELIARTNCDPPLAVISRSIPTTADAAVGFLVVHVPPSPSAPHMVDGRYIGRGDKTKRYLLDAEVLRLHASRASQRLDALQLLQAEFDRDIFNTSGRVQAHGFFVAEPMSGRRDMLLRLTDPPVQWEKVVAFTRRALDTGPASAAMGKLGRFAPDVYELQTLDRRLSCVAITTHGIALGRKRRGEDSIDGSDAELEIRDSGGLRIYISSLSRARPRDEFQVFFEVKAIGLSHRLVALAAAAAEESGYLGDWALAFGATGLKDSYSHFLSDQWADGSPYPEDVYTDSVVASYSDLVQRPWEIVDSLVGGLLRGFNTRQNFLYALTAPTVDAP
jgi:hypothetical protein